MSTSTRAKRFGPNVAVLGVRLLLLLAALSLAAAGVAIAVHDEPRGAAEPRYACPMHPEVSATAPGQCPICKMALELVDGSKPTAPATADGHPADCPMHAKGSTPTAKSADPHGAPMVAPSPEFAGGKTWLPETRPPAAPDTPSARPIFATTKRRVFVDDVRAPAWLEAPDRLSAVLYRDELVGLSKGESARFFRAAAPRVPIEVRLTDDSPAPWDASTSVVQFAVEPVGGGSPAREAGSPLRTGDVGWLEMDRRSRELVVFPESALLRSSEGPYVLVLDAQGGFVRRLLQIGRILKGNVVVLSGLRDEERIVVSRPFFSDGEHGGESRAGPLAEVVP